MSRFLFVVPPLVGHTNPTVAVGRELLGRGHEVAWIGYPEVIGPLLPDDASLIPVGGIVRHEMVTAMHRRAQGLRGAAAFRFLWQDVLIPLSISMKPGVEAAVDEFEPDVIVADQQALAGALIARSRRLPWATSATSPWGLTGRFTLMPKLDEWVVRQLYGLQLALGVPAKEARCGDLRFSDDLVLVYTSAALLGSGDGLPEQYVLVGPSIGARPQQADFPWEWLDASRRLVLVSLGTVTRDAGERFLNSAVDALAPLVDRIQAVIVAPHTLVRPTPGHLLVRDHVPQLELLARADAVVCHAGHNTVCESLAHGVPLVVAPIRDDQPMVAQQVVDAGAGIRVRFARVGPAELRRAVLNLLEDHSYRAAARRVQASFTAAGGPPRAAEHLEKLA